MSTEEILRQIAEKAGLTPAYYSSVEELAEAVIEEIERLQGIENGADSRALQDLKAVSEYYRQRLAIMFKILIHTDKSMDSQLIQITQMVESMLKNRESVREHFMLEDDPEDAERFNIVTLEKEAKEERASAKDRYRHQIR